MNGDGYADVIVGAPGWDGGDSNEGAALVYLGGAQGIVSGNPATAAAAIQSNFASGNLGQSVASAGDVNGDGYGDVIVGAPSYDNGQSSEGAAFIYLGGPSGIASGNPASAATMLEGNHASTHMGWSVASAGDVNGDGYGDVIVGANWYQNGQVFEGGAFVFLGGPSGVANGDPTTAAATLESNQVVGFMGDSVASAGDVNGDGYSDVIVGAAQYGAAGEGAAFVFLGGPGGVASGSPATAAAVLAGQQPGGNFGFTVASAGDVDGDGYADVIVGAPGYDRGETDEGAAFVFRGGATGIPSGGPATADAVLESNQSGAKLNSVAGAGDVNGDGYADVIVGFMAYANGEPQEGAAFLYLGGGSGVASGGPGNAAAILESNQAFAWLGSSVASAGDVNGDGYADVIVGALHYANGETSEGGAFVFLGGPGGIASGSAVTAAAVIETNQAGAGLISVASAGDVNGDGFADVIVGAYLYDDGETDEGKAFLFYGGGNRTGRLVLAAQGRGAVGGTPVQPWGASYGADFEAALRALDAKPIRKVKMEVQACASGVPFGHPSCSSGVTSSWVGSDIDQKLKPSGLADGKLYRWRARILYAPAGVTQPGITPPPKPAHGPWRRLAAQSVEADVRVGLDTDLDGLRDSIDPDDDDDGLSDAAEALIGTNPLDPDTDGDQVCDGGAAVASAGCSATTPDNCPFVVNTIQTNSDAFTAGDACQCGDVIGDGKLDDDDVMRVRQQLVGRTTVTPFDANRCDVTGDGACDVRDLAVLERLVRGAPATIVPGCTAYGAP